MTTDVSAITTSPARRALWDWQVRVCHWLMVVLIVACWWTAENHEIVYHSYCAYALLGVVLFRIYWGFFGSSTARFAQFIKKPSAVAQYVKTLPQRQGGVSAGHNALGGYSVLVLLALMLLQIGLGLFSIDVDGFDGGPFADYLRFKTSREIAEWHEVTFNVLLGFIVLHIVAVVYYLVWRRQNLTAAMIHGKTSTPVSGQPMKPASYARFTVGVLIAGFIVWLIA